VSPTSQYETSFYTAFSLLSLTLAQMCLVQCALRPTNFSVDRFGRPLRSRIRRDDDEALAVEPMATDEEVQRELQTDAVAFVRSALRT
jgi:hypothetical protein